MVLTQLRSSLDTFIIGSTKLTNWGFTGAGEVVIPLQEAASFGTMRSEVKRYTLGRRTTKEKVGRTPGSACRRDISYAREHAMRG
jgi:hypothetical protein